MIETNYQRLGDNSTAYIDESKPKQVKLDTYTICPDVLLGTGSFSSVYLCKDENNKKAAVKILSKNRKRSDHIIKVAKAEVKILKRLRHPNVVGYLGSYESENNYYILFDYCEGKTLRQLLNTNKSIDIQGVSVITQGLIKALSYMHEKKVMHRDIKPDNIKYFNGKTTLIDFGFACELSNGDKTLLKQSVGTPSYMSPEILQRKNYTYKSDIWSLGVVLYEIIYGKLPWTGRSENELSYNISKKHLQFPDVPKISGQLKKLIEGCLQKKPGDRMDIKQLSMFEKVKLVGEENTGKDQHCSFFCWMN